VVGVDEVGRGCLAGPVCAAAVILSAEFNPAGVTDSKLLSERRREELSCRISSQAQVSLGLATVDEIEQLNILHASLLAMKRAVLGLGVSEAFVLVDGHQKISGLPAQFQQTALIKGDLRALPIAAASIVAKVHRDRLMQELARAHPGYGFEKHKGYGSSEHRRAIQELGPCSQHRREFSGVREYLDPTPRNLR